MFLLILFLHLRTTRCLCEHLLVILDVGADSLDHFQRIARARGDAQLKYVVPREMLSYARFQSQQTEPPFEIQIAEGGYGRILLTKGFSEGHLVVKKQEIAAQYKSQQRTEAALLMQLKHHNIIPLLGLTPSCAIILPFYDLGSLRNNFKNPLLYRRVAAVIKGVIDWIRYLHANGVIHGDLSAENVLLKNSFDSVISDFGCAQTKEFSLEGLECIGVPYIQAPEVLQNNPLEKSRAIRAKHGGYAHNKERLASDSLRRFTAKVDVWAIGMLSCMLITGGKTLYRLHRTTNFLRTALKCGKLDYVGNALRRSQGRKCVVMNCCKLGLVASDPFFVSLSTTVTVPCLKFEPGDRPTAEELSEAMALL